MTQQVQIKARAGEALTNYTGYFCYRDSGDSYNVKRVTNPRNALIAGVILNNDNGDDYPCTVCVEGVVEVELGGAINVGQLVASDSNGKAVAATGGARVLGVFQGISNESYTTAGANGGKGQILLFGNKSGQVRMTGSKTHDFGSINSGEAATTTVAVTGAAVGDRAEIGPNAALATATTLGLFLYAYVSATDEVTIVCTNPTAGALNLASNTFFVEVFPN
jgi:hypothetical protein